MSFSAKRRAWQHGIKDSGSNFANCTTLNDLSNVLDPSNSMSNFCRLSLWRIFCFLAGLFWYLTQYCKRESRNLFHDWEIQWVIETQSSFKVQNGRTVDFFNCIHFDHTLQRPFTSTASLHLESSATDQLWKVDRLHAVDNLRQNVQLVSRHSRSRSRSQILWLIRTWSSGFFYTQRRLVQDRTRLQRYSRRLAKILIKSEIFILFNLYFLKQDWWTKPCKVQN